MATFDFLIAPQNWGTFDPDFPGQFSHVAVQSPYSIRAVLVSGIQLTSAMSDRTKYSISKTAPDIGVVPSITLATPNISGGLVNYITLATSEHTQSQNYTLSLVDVTSIENATRSYSGLGTRPTVTSVVGVSSTSVRVNFSEPMSPGDGLTSTGRYVITEVGGDPIAVTAVTPENVAYPTYVILTTAAMTTGSTYQIVVGQL